MELYKFINETEIQRYKGGFVVIDNRIYTNPKEETVRTAGYKELAEVEVPEYNPEKEYIEITYIDGDIITPVYTVIEVVSDIQEIQESVGEEIIDEGITIEEPVDD